MNKKLSHVDHTGKAKMVDVSAKNDTLRIAIAEGEVIMKIDTLEVIIKGNIKKGDVISTARIAGIMAAKRTSELIPMCHPLPIMEITVDLVTDLNLPGIKIISSVKTIAKTGVEMEALIATSVAALTVYDMAKSVEKSMRINNIRLIRKSGGSSGDVVND